MEVKWTGLWQCFDKQYKILTLYDYDTWMKLLKKWSEYLLASHAVPDTNDLLCTYYESNRDMITPFWDLLSIYNA